MYVRLFDCKQMLGKRLNNKTYLGLETQTRLKPLLSSSVAMVVLDMKGQDVMSRAFVVIVGWWPGIGIVVVVVLSPFRRVEMA